MNRNLRNFGLVIFINALSLVIGVTVYLFFDKKIELLGAVIAAGIGFSFNVTAFQIENDKIFKELFIFYNERYDNKFNDFLRELYKVNELNNVNSDRNEKMIVDYLNMCAEQYLWYTKRRIDGKVWSSWEKGMVYNLNIPSVRKIFDEERECKDSYYGFIEYIELKLGN